MKRAVVGIGVGLLVFGLFILVLGPTSIVRQLAVTDPLVFSLGLLATGFALLCWSEALRRLFAVSEVAISSWRSLLAYNSSMFGKQVLPMGHASGPALVAYTYDRETAFGYERTLAVVTVSEVLNFTASLVLAVVGIVYLVVFAPKVAELRALQVGIAVILAGLVVGGAVFWYRRSTVERVLGGVFSLLQLTVGQLSPRLHELLDPEQARSGLARYYVTLEGVASDRRALLSAYGYTQLGWISFAMPLYTGALAIDVQLPVAVALLLVPATGLVTIVPLPGGIGGFEVAMAALLVGVAGLELATAATVVLLYRLASYWFMVIVGGISSLGTTANTRNLVNNPGK